MYSLPRISDVFEQLPDFDALRYQEIEDICHNRFIDPYCLETLEDETAKEAKAYLLEDFLDKIVGSDVSHLNKYQEAQHYFAKVAFINAILEGVVKKEHLEGKILDFGCGEGGSSVYMSNFSKDITAVDIDKESLKILENTETQNPVNCIIAEGYDYLTSLPNHSLDMVTAFHLGNYNYPLKLVELFCALSLSKIKSGGVLMISSDIFTMEKVEETLKTPRIRYLPNFLFVNKQ